MYKILISLLLLLFIGCSSSTITVKEKEIPINVPDVKADSIPAVIKNATEQEAAIIDQAFNKVSDQVTIEGSAVVVDKTTGRKTNIDIKFNPGKKDSSGKSTPDFEATVKADPVKAKVQEKETVKEESTWDKIIIALFIIAGIVVLVKFVRKK